MNKIKLNILLLFSINFLLQACSISSKRENDTEDINKAKLICLAFLNLSAQNKLDSALYYTSGLSVSDLLYNSKQLDSLLGEYDRYEYINGSSNLVNKNSINTGSYKLFFNVYRKKGKSLKKIYLDNNNDIIKIVGIEDTYDL